MDFAWQEHEWDWGLLRLRMVAAARRVMDPQEAEDAVQEALIRAWRHQDRCHDQAAPLGWVLRIAHNEALRWRARNARRFGGDASVATLCEDHSPRCAGAIDAQAALRRLAPEDRMIALLRYQADLTTRDIATILGRPEATVRVRLHRLHKRLARELGDHEDQKP